VRGSCVLDRDHLPTLGPFDPQLLRSGRRIGEKALPETGVNPCSRHNSRTVGRRKLLRCTVRQRFGFARFYQSAINECVAQSKGSGFN
jgi:hypothetical protein